MGEILFLTGEIQSFVTHITENPPRHLVQICFWSFWAKYCHFLHILSNARPKTNLNIVPGWVFRYMDNKTFDFSSKKRIFCPKTTNFGQAMHAYLVPCWWVGWWLWRAGCISPDTYLL